MNSLAVFQNLFPLWALLASGLGYGLRTTLASWQGAIVPLLALVMFSMGLTLGSRDFLRIARTPLPVAIGVALQFLVMPLSALLVARLLQLPAELAAGLIIVGCCAGGTASNVICYLARGDVALSISMTMVSTLLGVVLTPLLSTLYLSRSVAVDSLGMFISLLQVVLLPVTAGILVNSRLRGWVKRLEPCLPLVAMLAILLIIAVIVALNAERLAEAGLITLLAVILHNGSGLAGGYWLSRWLGLDVKRSRTIAIEVGMQNSGLGVTLALQFYSAAAALPGALFSIWHNISGSLLAAYWHRRRWEKNSADTID